MPQQREGAQVTDAARVRWRRGPPTPMEAATAAVVAAAAVSSGHHKKIRGRLASTGPLPAVSPPPLTTPPAQANTARLTHGAATGKGEGKVEERGPAPRAPSGVTAAQTTTAPATPCTSHSRQTVRDRGCHRHVWHERRAAA